jgi:hypothetical protein
MTEVIYIPDAPRRMWGTPDVGSTPMFREIDEEFGRA